MPKTKVPLPEINPGTVKYTATFSHIPALCIIENYNDKIPVPGSTKGKQFKGGRFHGKDDRAKIASEAFAMTGNASTSLFDCAPSLFCNHDGKKEPYIDKDKMSEKFPNGDFRPKNCKKLGFMSTNFRAVDKYANSVNTERLRETLRKESALAKKVSKEHDERMEGYTSGGVHVPPAETLAPQKLYDVVHRQQPTSFKHARDDSQMRYVYMNQRRKEKGSDPHPTFEKLHGLTTKALHRQTNSFEEPALKEKDPTWVQVKLPTGAMLNVLVDEQNRIVGRNEVEPGQDVF